MNKKQLEAMVGKKLTQAKTFVGHETFKAYHMAEEFCRENGFSVGRMCNPMPTGIKRGDWDIQKWKNLSPSDKQLMDGVIVGNFRNGPVELFYSEEE